MQKCPFYRLFGHFLYTINCSFYEWYGGTKNQERIKYFQYPVKLVYLHTNWNFKNHQENQYFIALYIKSNQYRHKYRKTLQKSTLSSILHTQSKTSIQTTFFLYKYENPKKIHTFTDYQLFIKNQIKFIKITLISNWKREYINMATKTTNKKYSK